MVRAAESLFSRQLPAWPEAAARYADLASAVERRTVTLPSGLTFTLQHNPARAVSTMARVDAASIAARPCFLCASHRPACQLAEPLLGGRYELLVNPYPIFAPHFVIAATAHLPQTLEPAGAGWHAARQMVEIAGMMEGYVVFYNGAGCGASAPDHLHLQAVRRDSLPLTAWLESGQQLPYRVLHSVGAETVEADGPMVCAFAWIGADGRMHTAVIPRRAHRPGCYGPAGVLVSPASIDLAGVLVVPRRSDYDTLDAALLSQIISDVTF